MTRLVDRLIAQPHRPSAPSSSSHNPNSPDDLPLRDLSNPSPSLPGQINDPRPGPSPPSSTASPPSMDETLTNHRRRRSSSLVIPAGNSPNVAAAARGHRRVQSESIKEADEYNAASGGDDDSETGSSDFELDDMYSDDGVEDDEETGLTSDRRRRRRRRKMRNTRLDERVAGDVKITKEEEQLATESMLRSILINTMFVVLWYLFSISISLYNRWMFKKTGDDDEAIVFPYPLFTTCLHQIVQFCLASLVLFFFPMFRPRHDSVNPHHSFGDPPPEPVDPRKPLMTRWFYFTRIGPCGIGNALDIGLGNMSLKFISLTFFTMCKSSALGFVLLFAFLFGLEQPSWKLVGIICTMTVGVLMMVAGETAFHVLGFILVMSSACSSGFRWALTQILLLRNPATSNPFSTILFLAPVMFTSLLILAIPVEGFSGLADGLSRLMEAKGSVMGIGLLLFPGTLAFCMTASEFALLKRTSVVTLSICGIFKEVVTIGASNLVFEDKLTPINISGLVITIASIAVYNYIKIKKMRDDARMDAHLAHEDYAPVLSTEPESDRGAGASAAPRRSTGHIIRNSLSIPAILPSDRLPSENSPRTSPIKRPEDID